MYVVASGKASRLALGYALGYFVHKWYQFVVQYFTDYDTRTIGDSDNFRWYKDDHILF